MNEPVKKVSDYCEAFDVWARACMTDLPDDDEYKKKWRAEFREHWQFLHLAASKSNLLWRLIYGGEKLRTVPCPEHKGRWSGCFYDCPHGCNYGNNVTGWLAEPGEAT